MDGSFVVYTRGGFLADWNPATGSPTITRTIEDAATWHTAEDALDVASKCNGAVLDCTDGIPEHARLLTIDEIKSEVR